MREKTSAIAVEVLIMQQARMTLAKSPPGLPKSSLASTTNLISCTPSVPSSIGTSGRVWKRENSARLVKILQLLKKTTRKWALKQRRERARKRVMVTSSDLRALHVHKRPSVYRNHSDV